MKTHTHLAWPLCTFLLLSCSLEPAYVRPEAPVSKTYPDVGGYGTGDSVGRSAAGDIGWRNLLTDPRLQRLIDISLRNNRDLRVAVLKVAEVRARYEVQRAGMFPTIGLDSSGTQTRTATSLLASGKPAVMHSTAVDLSITWELDFFGRIRSLSEADLEAYLANAYARQAAEILLVSQVADQYLTVLARDEQLAVTRMTLVNVTSSLVIVQRRFDVGTASEVDLDGARAAVEQAKSQESDQVRQHAQAENALALLIGETVPLDLPPALRLSEQNIQDDIPAGLPSELLTRRPDILQAEAMLRSENANIGAARAAFFPQISLTGSFGSASSSLAGLLGAGSKAWTFVPALAVPIFNAGANRANLNIAQLQKEIGIAQYEKAIQTAFREVADGLVARNTYNEQVVALQRQVSAEARRLGIASLRYESGVDGYLNVLSAQQDLYNAQLMLVSARLSRLEALVDLYRCLGGGWIRETGEQRGLEAHSAIGK